MSDKRIPAELRRLVTNRAQNCCEYCRLQSCFSADSFTVDHILPWASGGQTVFENLSLCCHGCNQHKSTKTFAIDPATELPAAVFNPRQQSWEEHFAWNDDFTLIIGLTATGRATIEALWLNRNGLVNLRRALYAVGGHPPKLPKLNNHEP